MSMFEKINKVIEERYLDGDHITLYDENGVHLANVIEPMLEEETISQYSVNYSEVYDNPGVTIYYFSIAYVEDGVLEHLTNEDLSMIFASNNIEFIKDEILASCLGRTKDNYSFYIIPIQNVFNSTGLKQNILSFLYSFI